MRSLLIVAFLLSTCTIAAQQPASRPVETNKTAAAQRDGGRHVFFAFNGYTFTRLLRLRADGIFTGYAREHVRGHQR